MAQATEGEDAIDVIEADHRAVEQLFRQLTSSTSAEERQRIGEQIICDLSIHAAVEEQLLYPRARHLLHNDKLVDHAIDEHSQLKRVLDDLDGQSPDDAGFVSGFAEAQRRVEEHVGEEERDLLPRLRGAATSSELRKLGEHIQTAKKAAPTHPHPHAPSKPPFNMVLGPIAGLVDKVRDAARSHAAV
jgi:hemerythrin superfamily protein